MRTSNENEARSFSKLALLASAAATAALVIGQRRLMQSRAEAVLTPPRLSPPNAAVAQTGDVRQDEPASEVGSGVSQAEDPATGVVTDHVDEDSTPPPPAAAGRVRFRTSRPARDRLQYGLPVHHRRLGRNAPSTQQLAAQASTAPLTPLTPSIPVFDGDDFDPEYLAIVAAIASDVSFDDDDDGEDALVAAPPHKTPDTIADMWWLPAPRLQYIFAALVFVAVAAAIGSDPATLAAEGFRALTTVNTTADLILLGWVLCGLIVVVPLGAIAVRLGSLATGGRLRLPRLIAHDTADSAGWGLRLLATSAFIAGAVLYTPHALSWALDTDYPVAAMASSSMSPALHEGELVFIQGVGSPAELNVGDIIAFRIDGGIAVRRVAGFVNDAIITSADSRPDEELLVALEDIAGKTLRLAGSEFKLPFLGNIALLGERTVEPHSSLTGLP